MKRLSIIFFIVCSIYMIACSSETSYKADKESQTDGEEKIEQKVLFIYQHTSFGDGYINQGHFIDNQGNKIEYDLSTEGYENAEISGLYNYLSDLDNTQGEKFVTLKDLSECFNSLKKIDTNYTLEEECVGADMGSYCWYGVLDTGEESPSFILLSENGDWVRTNTDINVKTITELLLNQ